MKLKILVDEAVISKSETKPNAVKDKRIKCGQCEKKVAFTVNHIDNIYHNPCYLRRGPNNHFFSRFFVGLNVY